LLEIVRQLSKFVSSTKVMLKIYKTTYYKLLVFFLLKLKFLKSYVH